MRLLFSYAQFLLAGRTTARTNIVIRSAGQDKNSPNEYPKTTGEHRDQEMEDVIGSLLLCEGCLTTSRAVLLRNLNAHFRFLISERSEMQKGWSIESREVYGWH